MTASANAPDLLDRHQARVLRLIRGRPRLMRNLGRVRVITVAATLVLLIVASFVEFAILKAVIHVVLMVATVLIALLLTPTRSIPVSTALRWLMISAGFAPVIALTSVGASALAGLPTGYDGAEIVTAGVIEEIGKLAPLAALALIGPNTLRRLNRTDWLVLGYLSGAGFAIVEEASRLLYFNVGKSLGMAFAQLDGLHNPRFTPNPLGLAPIAEGVTGHVLWTGLVVGAVGLAFRLAARGHRFAAILPLAALVAVISDHASSNAALIAGGGLELLEYGAPASIVLGLMRFALLDGWLVIAAVVALWCWALASDAVERHRRPDTGLTAKSRRVVARVLGHGRAGIVLGGPIAVGTNWRDDLVRTLRAVGRLPSNRSGVALLPLALELGPAGRRASGPWPAPGLRASAVVFLTAMMPAGLLVAVFGAAAIGWTIGSATDDGLPWDWLAGLLEGLSSWWNDLPWYNKAVILSLLGVFLLGGFPLLSSAAVLQYLGWASAIASYGGPLVAALQNPGLIGKYLQTTEPKKIAADLTVLLLNYPVPATRGAFTRELFETLFANNPQLWQATAKELYQSALLHGDQQLAEQLVDALGIENDTPLGQQYDQLSNPGLAILDHYANLYARP